MSIPGSLAEQISHRLSELLALHVDVEQSTGVGGGSINDAWRIDTNEGRYFLKTNSADRFPSMFEAEADGLERLRAANALPIPNVLGYGEDHDTSWLLLEWLESSPPGPGHWSEFGQKLADQHSRSAANFGLERDNYIGSLLQRNKQDSDWSRFFIQQRLEPLIIMARDNGRIGAGAAFRFERFFTKLDELFPKETPALLHGDLWSGNFVIASIGRSWLIDPAVYYGHREMDIAMTRLFGGFDPDFYTGYQAAYPLEKGWEERVDICNLYPLLVHVNLFGGGYVERVEEILQRWS